jgi:Cys-tRNA(Pro)/Cys-tRNA(Cys) deacylase
MKDVEEKLPFPKNKLLKTLVFRIKGCFWVFAVVRGKDKVDYKKLSKALDVSRSDIVRPPAQEVETELSLEIGGICPIPINDNIKVVFDESVKNLEVVFCGVGRNDKSLEIAVGDLIRVSKAKIESIVQDEAE